MSKQKEYENGVKYGLNSSGANDAMDDLSHIVFDFRSDSMKAGEAFGREQRQANESKAEARQAASKSAESSANGSGYTPSDDYEYTGGGSSSSGPGVGTYIVGMAAFLFLLGMCSMNKSSYTPAVIYSDPPPQTSQPAKKLRHAKRATRVDSVPTVVEQVTPQAESQPVQEAAPVDQPTAQIVQPVPINPQQNMVWVPNPATGQPMLVSQAIAQTFPAAGVVYSYNPAAIAPPVRPISRAEALAQRRFNLHQQRLLYGSNPQYYPRR